MGGDTAAGVSVGVPVGPIRMTGSSGCSRPAPSSRQSKAKKCGSSVSGGLTWTERGAGLPPGRAVALGENPDHVLYGARNRLHVSGDGGVFWRAVAVELPEIHDVAWG